MKKAEKILLSTLRIYFNSIAFLDKKRAANQLISIFSRPTKRVIRKKEKAILKNAIRTDFAFDNKSIKLYKWGTGKKTALLIHGWESNAGSLGAFVEPLLENDFSIIAFDAPAHGASDGKKANLIYFKRAAKEVIKHFGKPDVLIGHSLGANAIILTAFEEQMAFEKVVLIAPLNRLMSVFEMYQGLLKIPPMLFNLFVAEFGKRSGYQFEDFYFHKLAKESPIKKALILHDLDDQITSFNDSDEMASNWEIAQLEKIDGTGHYSILWKNEVIEKALHFIVNS